MSTAEHPSTPLEPNTISGIVYVVGNPLSARDFDRFGIGWLVEQGIEAVIVDVGDIMHPQIDHDRGHYSSFDGITLHAPASKTALKALEDVFCDADLIVFLAGGNGISRRNLSIARLITRSNSPYLVIKPPTNPGWEYNRFRKREGGRTLNLLKLFLKKDFLNSLIARIPPNRLGIHDADYLLDCCPGINRRNSLVGPKTREISGHAFDYDIFRRESQKDTPVLDQAVFIDQYLPFHHDQHETQLVFRLDPEKYYGALNRFFARVEAELGLKVVIAAHPRADYRRHSDLFSNRPIHYGSTAKLILESQLILVQTSTAIGLAVMARKPVMLLNSKEMDNLGIERFVFQSLSKALGVPLTPIDQPDEIEFNNVFEVNDLLYDQYLQTYVKSANSPDKPLWQLVVDEVSGDVRKSSETPEI